MLELSSIQTVYRRPRARAWQDTQNRVRDGVIAMRGVGLTAVLQIGASRARRSSAAKNGAARSIKNWKECTADRQARAGFCGQDGRDYREAFLRMRRRRSGPKPAFCDRGNGRKAVPVQQKPR